MAQRDFNLVLRFHSDDPTVFETFKTLFQETARNIHAAAVLVAAGRSDVNPHVSIYSDDFFEGETKLDEKEGGLGGAEKKDDDKS